MSNQDDTSETPGQVTGPIIIGIDFGASCTAAAYIVLNDENQQPTILDNWPTAYRSENTESRLRIKSKISTGLYYDQHQKASGWGEENDVYMTVGWIRPEFQWYDHFKYSFAPLPNSKLQTPRSPLGKTVEDAMTEFLSNLRGNVLKQVAAELDRPDASKDPQYVMTVPASWNEETLSRFTALAKEAGFLAEIDKDLTLVSGTESVMLQTLSSNPSSFEVGDYVLVADCGDHLVEMVTYQVKSKNPWRIEKCTDVSVEACGVSQAINRFNEIALDRVKKTKLPPFSSRRLYRSYCYTFAHKMVSIFGNPGLVGPHECESRNHSRVGYFKMDVTCENEFEEPDLYDGYFWHSYEEILSYFEPVADGCVKLLEEQVGFNEERGQVLKVSSLALEFCDMINSTYTNYS